MILDGLVLMFTGTGVVFLFLMLLIMVTKYSSRLLARFDKQPQERK